MFAIILAICGASNPFMLWIEHGTDFVSGTRNYHEKTLRLLEDDEVSKRYILQEIQEILTRLNGGILESHVLSSPAQKNNFIKCTTRQAEACI